MRKPLLVAWLLNLLVAASGRAYTFQSTGLYQSFDEMTAWAANLAAANPDLVNVVQYGVSVQGRPLLALDITVNASLHDPSKPEFLFAAGIHAREVVGSQAAYQLAEYLVNGYRHGESAVTRILTTRDVWIIPDQNPDGRLAVEGGYSQQRKNMDLYDGQNPNDYTRGVDLNRNYPHLWHLASSDARDETFRGGSAVSMTTPPGEPESQSLWTLLHNRSEFSHLLAAVDIHSGAATVLTPWTSPSDFAAHPLPAADRAKFDSLADRISHLTGYSTARLGYDSYGTLTDSLYEEFGTYSMTEEIFGGPFYDYFSYFNPVDQATRDATVDRFIASAMYLLSDDAFAVPEPEAVVLLAAGGVMLLAWMWRHRQIPQYDAGRVPCPRLRGHAHRQHGDGQRRHGTLA